MMNLFHTSPSRADALSQKEREWNPGEFDYFDFGCSNGGTLLFIKKFWPKVRGMGIDINPHKIELAVDAGHDAIVYNILNLPSRKITRFVTMCHFLEHLGSISDADEMIRKAIDIAEGFVFIRQPWFDADGFLLCHNFKFYWSHWHGHRNHMSSLDFYSILSAELENGKIKGFDIFGRDRVKTTDDSCFIPLNAPIDEHHYNPDKHGAKPPAVVLPMPTFKEIIVTIRIGEDPLYDMLLAKYGKRVRLYSSEQQTEIPTPARVKTLWNWFHNSQ